MSTAPSQQPQVLWGLRIALFLVLIALGHFVSKNQSRSRIPIREYTVATDASLQQPGYRDPFRTRPSEGKPTDRMLAAILPLPGEFWVFKLTGPVAMPDSTIDSIDEFLRSLQREGDRVVWTVPAGWTDQGASAMRETTLQLPAPSGGTPLELAISRLPRPPGDLQVALLQNVNRWRGQLSLRPIAEDRLDEMLKKFTSQAGEIYLLNLTGVMQRGGPAMTPSPEFSNDAARGVPQGESPVAVEPPRSAAAPIFTIPSAWKPGRLNEFRTAAFQLEQDGTAIEITVSKLPVGGGDRLSNVNRWRGQLGLPPLAAGDLTAAVETLSVDGKPVQLVELDGPAGASAKSLYAAMTDRGDWFWAIKLQGDQALAQSQRDAFRSFVSSFRWPSEN